MKNRGGGMQSNRGVALIIVLLVTALLVALVFEFAYGTRISLRSALNFRDSQRAYFLARSGVNFAGALLADNLKNGKLQDNIEQRDWQVVPVMVGSDAELRVRWEDESGKISIGTVIKGNDAYNRLSKLFDIRSIGQDNLDRIADAKKAFQLLTEMHQFLSDEDFRKVRDFITMRPLAKVNINSAPSEVLQSIGISSGMAGMVVERRNRDPFKKPEEVNSFLGPENTLAAGSLALTSDVFRVHSFATVGGYTKQVEAIITRSATGYTINYWRAM